MINWVKARTKYADGSLSDDTQRRVLNDTYGCNKQR